MIRRDFLGSLAALMGARLMPKAEQPIAPVPASPLPVVTSGFVQVEGQQSPAYDTWAIANTDDQSSAYVHLDYDAHMRGEGIEWHYTASP